MVEVLFCLPRMTQNTTILGTLAVVLGLASGCSSSGVQNPSGVPVTVMKADEQGFIAGSGIESQDLVAVTDKMERTSLAFMDLLQEPTK